MRITQKVKRILANYAAENAGVKTNLVRILMHGKLAGSGKLLILPVDQGFEHGPVRSFATNAPAYDPHYHFRLAVNCGLSAYAAPLGMLASGMDTFVGAVPLILKLNSSNALSSAKAPDQAITATVQDALSLGCSAVGFTIYPGSSMQFEMFEEAREIIREAKSYGLATVLWSYPRGEGLSKAAETAVDVIAYSCHIAALLGADIIKVKIPDNYIEQDEARKAYLAQQIPLDTVADRVAHVRQAAFNGRRLVVFSGGAAKDENALYEEIRQVNIGGGNGSIIGRNAFQRPYQEAVALLNNVINIYRNS